MHFSISPEVRAMGIDARAVIVRNMKIANRNASLERMKKALVEIVRSRDLEHDAVLREYRAQYERLGHRELIPPAEHLARLILQSGRLPTINTAVDIYNLVAVETSLAMGAHDCACICGDLELRVTRGTEQYLPLNERTVVTLPAGEYACVDEEKVICRLDVRQCDQTKVSKSTREFIVYVQGNRRTSEAQLRQALARVCELVKEIGGAEYQTLATNVESM